MGRKKKQDVPKVIDVQEATKIAQLPSLASRGLYLSLKTLAVQSASYAVTGTFSMLAELCQCKESAVRFSLKELPDVCDVETDGDGVRVEFPELRREHEISQQRSKAGLKGAYVTNGKKSVRQNERQDERQNLRRKSVMATGTPEDVIGKTNGKKNDNNLEAEIGVSPKGQKSLFENSEKKNDPTGSDARCDDGEPQPIGAGLTTAQVILNEWNLLPGMKQTWMTATRKAKIIRNMEDSFFATYWRDAMDKLREDGVTGWTIEKFLKIGGVREILNGKAVDKGTFQKPTVEEVRDYVEEMKLEIDPQYFVDYYEARGWRFNSGEKMKDWKATCRNWHKMSQERKSIPSQFSQSKAERRRENNLSVLREIFEEEDASVHR